MISSRVLGSKRVSSSSLSERTLSVSCLSSISGDAAVQDSKILEEPPQIVVLD